MNPQDLTQAKESLTKAHEALLEALIHAHAQPRQGQAKSKSEQARQSLLQTQQALAQAQQNLVQVQQIQIQAQQAQNEAEKALTNFNHAALAVINHSTNQFEIALANVVQALEIAIIEKVQRDGSAAMDDLELENRGQEIADQQTQIQELQHTVQSNENIIQELQAHYRSMFQQTVTDHKDAYAKADQIIQAGRAQVTGAQPAGAQLAIAEPAGAQPAGAEPAGVQPPGAEPAQHPTI